MEIPGNGIRGNGWQKKKTSESLGRVGVDSGSTEDCAALEKEVHEIGLNTIRLEEALPLLQDSPYEDSNL